MFPVVSYLSSTAFTQYFSKQMQKFLFDFILLKQAWIVSFVCSWYYPNCQITLQALLNLPHSSYSLLLFPSSSPLLLSPLLPFFSCSLTILSLLPFRPSSLHSFLLFMPHLFFPRHACFFFGFSTSYSRPLFFVVLAIWIITLSFVSLDISIDLTNLLLT